MRLSAVDIGSNTTLLLIVEKKGPAFNVLSEELYFTRLAEGLSRNRLIGEGALFRLQQAFQSISLLLKKFQVDRSSIVATSACRQAENPEDLFRLGKACGLPPIKIISPEREAELTFIGAIFGLGHDLENPLVIDIGGGSTEIVSRERSYSFNLGSVTLTEKFLTTSALSRTDKVSLLSHIETQITPVKGFLRNRDGLLIFVAGTPITLAFMEKGTSDPNKIHGTVLTDQQVDKWFEKLSGLSLQERKRVPHLPEHRSDVIVSGLALLKTLLSATGKKEFIVSAAGVRYGLVLEQCQ